MKRFVSAENPPTSGAGQGALAYVTTHRDRKILGRFTAHEHGASNRLYDFKRGYFDYLECADDGDAAKALTGAAESWCRAGGLSEVAGNFNLSAKQQIGVMADGFDHAPYHLFCCWFFCLASVAGQLRKA
ncbi:hypothetical protein [Octadecabacter antarcticus]|uniref:hypothetical protein n=1 Tax=Octadecabacter antarcticus TaxID=1217908 RepID=UPI0001805F75|nr:hypothetical protein [Octadecabacter antarcticus]